MAHMESYRTNVKLGDWNEISEVADKKIEWPVEMFSDQPQWQDARKEYLWKKERGELAIQQLDFLKENILRPVNLTVTTDGRLHFGDVVMLVNAGGEEREWSTVNINADVHSLTRIPSPGIQAPCGVSAGRRIQACVRSAFIITSVDGSPGGSTLHFEQSFALKTTSGFAGEMYLMSDLKSFHKYAKKSRLQEVNLDYNSSFVSWWKIVHFDPQERLENEGQPVPANVSVLIVHCKTNQALAVLDDYILRTTYDKEYEVTAHTFLDSHKAEQDNNHWMLCTGDPAANGLIILNHPQSAANNKELAQANPGT